MENGPYTAAARDAFLATAARYSSTDDWTEEEDACAGELDGYLVFRSVSAVLEYGGPHARHRGRFLVLTGSPAGPNSIEDDSLLLQDFVIRDGPLSFANFCARYGSGLTACT